MNDVVVFLKILQKTGYPNDNIVSIARNAGYNLDSFLVDLKEELGEEGVREFCTKAINKLQGEKGVKVTMDPHDEYCYIKIIPIYYDEDESENDIIVTNEWGKSKILGDDENGQQKYLTIEELIENTDMGGWAELDELIDYMKGKAYNVVLENCGFGVWWQ